MQNPTIEIDSQLTPQRVSRGYFSYFRVTITAPKSLLDTGLPAAHNPKVAGSNPAPQPNFSITYEALAVPRQNSIWAAMGAKEPEKQYEQKPQQAQHGASLTRKARRNRKQFYLTDSAADRNFGEPQV